MVRPHLLLIDDEPALATFVASAAQECDYHPAVATDEGDFRRRYGEQRPDVVVLDLGMPGMDGVELLRFLSEEKFRGPVLIISGFDRRVLDSAFRLGKALGLTMVGPLEKPTRLEELETILREVRPVVPR